MHQLCTPPELAANIRAELARRQLTIRQMCDTLHIGINTINQISAGAYPRLETLYRIAEYIGVTVNDLVYKD